MEAELALCRHGHIRITRNPSYLDRHLFHVVLHQLLTVASLDLQQASAPLSKASIIKRKGWRPLYRPPWHPNIGFMGTSCPSCCTRRS
ncbi:hypothetical protein SAY87_030997 [Trapa incisa]|uniref:Uncharacterized protein n=1 Tax=Trapa incisa TaxID=236973 RepID=A0AAN7QP35_9MYRT|nr:hypothetical protein SAY87_030997 [Trapa incisa]